MVNFFGTDSETLFDLDKKTISITTQRSSFKD